jgi:hypothetical protein
MDLNRDYELQENLTKDQRDALYEKLIDLNEGALVFFKLKGVLWAACVVPGEQGWYINTVSVEDRYAWLEFAGDQVFFRDPDALVP